ncbi:MULTISPECIES: N-acetylneuraminate synthase family protein [unclassified Polaribacter]|uniref:N-acetylneuraminate synthase family protein n=1 Tax=unclassified Polaribacter TaxID=196858 RepID=UPI001408A9B5|nr:MULTISPECIES: N-acetylneuraminate synthase family protein [unclassified Polaribacter]
MINKFKGKHGPLLIAEIGGNHEGNFEYALELTKLAIDADVDYIKYQMYSGDTLVSQQESPVRNKHFKKFELSKEQYIQLAELCEANNVGFMASVWDLDYISWIDKYMPIYKIGSGDFTAYPILEGIVKLKKPIILSTGLSTQQEVLDTVKFIQNLDSLYLDKQYLSVLQCTSMYPIPYSSANLSVMDTYKKETDLTIGYSDHTEGSYALEIAVAMGAEILEFHFTDSRENKEFRDHKVSLTKNEVLDLISKIKKINDLKGNPIKTPTEIEIETGHCTSFRRAVYPIRNLKAGTIITKDDLAYLRPNHGIDARDYKEVIGKTLKEDVIKHQKITFEILK